MIYDNFRVTGARDTVLDYADLFSLTLHDDKIREFDTIWDEVLLSTSKIPSHNILESLYKLSIRESAQLKTVLELRSTDQKHRLRNFDARHGRMGTGAVVKNRKGMSGVEGGKGIVTSGKKKRPAFERRPM